MTSAAEPREHNVEARGLSFHYVEWGEADAPPIVAMHGLSSTCRIWDTFARAFQDRYRIIALDQRGHGQTSWPEEPDYGTDDFAGDLEALIDAWGLAPAILIGLSMGGMNAIAYAARHPDRVTHVIPVDIPPSLYRDPNSPQQEGNRKLAEQGHPTFEDQEAVFRSIRATNQTTPDEALRHRIRHITKQLDGGKWTFRHDPRVGLHWSPTDLWDELPKIQAPVLIVRGGKSMVLADETAGRMRDAFPNAELFTSEESGHHVPEDTAELFNETVEDFLKRNPG